MYPDARYSWQFYRRFEVDSGSLQVEHSDPLCACVIFMCLPDIFIQSDYRCVTIYHDTVKSQAKK